MSEAQDKYSVETQETLEMLGKGYEPSVTIEAPHSVVERRGGKLVEVEKTAFIKLYTSFKRELKDIEATDLKVWIYLALSVNRDTKKAKPSLRTIASDLGIAVNTVRASLTRLENCGLLDVENNLGRGGNNYRPADYVSVSRNVSKIDTLSGEKNVSISEKNVSISNGNVSTQYRKFAQLEELDLTRGDIRFAKTQKALEKIGILLTANDPTIIDIWLDKHTDEWIQKAIDITQAKGIRNIGYIKTILAGWLENGYPSERQNKSKKQPAPQPQPTPDEILKLQASVDWSVI
jgi:DnaD/phage-associated family protein